MSLTFFFKDKNLKPENIRKGVRIGKVLGTLEGGGGSGNNQDITANSSTLEQTITFEDEYDGIGLFTLLPYVLQSKTVNSSTSSQTVTPDSGYDGLYQVLVNPYVLDTKSLDPSTVSQTVNSSADGMSSVSISAVTSSIDSNIQSGNIKDGVTILGVTGNMAASGDWIADVRKGTLGDMSNKVLSASSTDRTYRFSNLFYNLPQLPEKVFPQFSGTSTSNSEFRNCFYNCKNIHPKSDNNNEYNLVIPFTSIGNYGMSGFLQDAYIDRDTTISFPNLTSIGSYSLSYFIATNDSNYHIAVSMPNLTSISSYGLYRFAMNYKYIELPDFIPNLTSIGDHGMYQAFYSDTDDTTMSGAVEFTNLVTLGTEGLSNAFYNRKGLTSVSFPALTTLTGSNCMEYAFNRCSGLTSVSFPALTALTGNRCMSGAFYGCSGLTSVGFPELTTISNYGMNNCFVNNKNLTTISFPELTTISNYGMYNAFENCTSLTSVSFPEWTTASGTSAVAYMFDGCSNLTTFSAPKLSTYASSSAMFGSSNTTLTTVTLHPGCLKSNTYSPITNCTGITSLTFSEDATDDVNVIWQPNLSFNSVADVLGHLDLNTSGKTCSFYSDGLTVTDDSQGSLQTLYDAAVNAGWTISNLTITPFTA